MIFHILAACLVLAFFAAPATADMIVYGWRSPEGAYEFTDDITRIPVANLDFVQRFDVDGLEEYERFTKDDFVKPLKAQETTSEDAPRSTITTEEVVEVGAETGDTDRRRKRHRSDR